jgi:hypothetical protein
MEIALIRRDSVETIMHSDDMFAPVAYLHIKEAHLEAKDTHGMDSDLMSSLRKANELVIPPFDIKKHLEDLSLSSTVLPEVKASISEKVLDIQETSEPVAKGSLMYIPGVSSLQPGTVEQETKQVFQRIRRLNSNYD